MKFLASPFIACGGGWKQPKIELSGQHRLQNRSKRLDTSLIRGAGLLRWLQGRAQAASMTLISLFSWPTELGPTEVEVS